MIDASIIIVNWNTKDRLKECLCSIYEQNVRCTYEVIVVDNASSDGSIEMVKREFPRVILVENQENKGFAAANNIGINAAKGRYYLLLNSDTVVLGNVIDEVVSFADSESRVAVVGCRVLNPDRTLQPTCFMFPSLLNMILSSIYLYKLFPRSRFLGREQMTWWNRDDTREVEVVTGCFMLVRRQAVEEVGVLDERFFMYGEETDWCYRFKQAGWKVVFAPVGQIIHFGGASSSKMAAGKTLQLRGAILQFIAKHYSKATYISACVLTGVFFSIRVPFWLIRTIISPQNRLSYWGIVKVYSKGVFKLLHGHKGLLVKTNK
ncbi:MAG: glycosyltransferase family 2 protein [Sedimentisphaerales bacterium]